MSIKAIIFDLEGVLMRTGEKDLPASWAKALNASYEDVREVFFGEMNDKADLGLVSQIEFDQYMIDTLGLEADMLPEVQRVIDEQCYIDQELAREIVELKKRFKIALLTNYTEMIREKIENEWDIKHLFDTIIISSEVGMIKPDPAVFELVLSQLGALPHETVLIDDRVKNITGARDFGMHAIMYEMLDQSLAELETLIDREQ